MLSRALRLPRGGLWSHAEFRRLWGAQTVSVFGDQISLLALPLTAVLILDASPAQMGLLTAAAWAPHLVLSLWAGAWIDRREGRRDVMVAADLARAAVLVTVPLAYALGALTLAHVFAVAVAVGALTVGFDLSYSTYFVVVVPSEDIVDANSKLMTSRAASYVAGPSLAGVLVQVLTAPVALLVDAASFVGSALLIRRMKTPEPPAAEPGEPLRSRLAAGARFLFSQPVLRSGLACVTTVNFFNFAFAAEVVLFLARELDLSPGVIGLVFSVGALGALAGAVLAPRIGARIGYGPAVAAGCVLFSAPLLLFALAGGPRLVELAMLAAGELLSGVGVMVFDVNLNSIQALLTPHRLRGRVGGVFRTINYGVRPAGALVGGALGATIGLRPTLAIGAVGATLAVVFALARPLRTLRELPEAAA